MDNIFAGLPIRHVESANARLEIRRDESQANNRKKTDEHSENNNAIEWEDTAYVSILSLKTFLESIVHTSQDEVFTPQVHEAKTTLNQRAASAYQNAGRAGHDSNVTPSAPPPSHIETNFTDEDLNRVRIFIADLTELERAGVTELAMKKSATFLDSIEAAIAEAKSR